MQLLTYSSVRFAGGVEVHRLWIRAWLSVPTGTAHGGTADGVADHSFPLLKRLLLRAAVGGEVLHDQLHPSSQR